MGAMIKSPYLFIYAAGLFIFLITAFFSEGYIHPDEHFQVLEFCHYKLGFSSYTDLPWEFHEKIRPALQPLIAMGVIRLLIFVNLHSPFTWVLILRLLTALFSWWVISRMTYYLEKEFSSESGKKLFILLSFFLWFVPVISVRFSSENYGGLTFLLALYCLLSSFEARGKKKIWLLISAGMLLGFSFFFRFQVAFAILGLGMWLLLVKKINGSTIFILLLSGTSAIFLSSFADYLFYGEWTCTPLNYFYVNIIEHRSEHWGIRPWWHYFKMFIDSAILPIGILLLICFLIGLFKKSNHLLTWCILPFIIGHILVGHKEMRFMFPMVFPFIFLTAQGIAQLMSVDKYRTVKRFVFTIYIIINMPVLVITSIIPARDSVCYFKFLNRYTADKKMEILCIEKDLYETVGLETNFYKSKNVECHVVCDTIGIAEYLNKHQPDLIYTLERDKKENIIYPGYNKENLYSLFPEWLLKNNMSHWQDRTRIWKIVKLEKI